jgi:hypothetical protein
MFWKDLLMLRKWEQVNLPVPNLYYGTELVIWLLKNADTPAPLKSFYQSSRCSEPTARLCIRAFEDNGLVVVHSNDRDMRAKYIRRTPKFDAVVSEYRRMIAELSQEAIAPGDSRSL